MFGRLLAAVDGFQQRNAFVGFPLAVLKKFGEDNGGHQATLLAYYGFFSLLPLLLVAVTVLSFVLNSDVELRDRIIDSALGQFPIIGEDIRTELTSITGNAIALVVGLAGALWGGVGGIRAMQDSMNVVWDVPYRERPGFLPKILRAALTLLVLAIFMIGSTALSAVGAVGAIEGFARAVTIPASVALNVVVFALAYRVLTAADLGLFDVLPGSIVAAIAWAALQAAGTYVVGSRLEGASELYGFFGIVIGLLFWLYLGAQITLLAAEINVVRKHRLWPRAIDMGRLTVTDRKALERRARVEERVKGQRISVRFDPDDDEPAQPDPGKGA